MKTLQDNTYIPETPSEIEHIARQEAECNIGNYFDFTQNRSRETKYSNIYHGKLAECIIASKFYNSGHNINSGVSFLRETPDNGTDLIVDGINIQVKCVKDKYFNIIRPTILRKLKDYNGKILLYREANQTVYELTKDILKYRTYQSKYNTECYYIFVDDLKPYIF